MVPTHPETRTDLLPQVDIYPCPIFPKIHPPEGIADVSRFTPESIIANNRSWKA
jgi:hypothetical protein